MNDFKKQSHAANDAAPVLETLLDLNFDDINMCIEPIKVEQLQTLTNEALLLLLAHKNIKDLPVKRNYEIAE